MKTKNELNYMQKAAKQFELIRANWTDDETIFWENLSSFEIKEGNIKLNNNSPESFAPMHKALNQHFGFTLLYVGSDKHYRFFLIDNFAE